MFQPPRYPVKATNLEVWLHARSPDDFPPFDSARGEKPHSERYLDIKRVLAPYQLAAEKGALLASAVKWKEEQLGKIRSDYASDASQMERRIQELEDSSPFVYLNAHGEGHVDKVIQRASELLQSNPECALTAYEGYLLLCAIQFHDIGNFFGREGHEQKCSQIMEHECRQIVRDRIERNTIVRIAMVHGGAYDGNRDTIALLRPAQDLMGQRDVQKRFLAALLRFADELADDYSRADTAALNTGILPTESVKHHRYSESLHTVAVSEQDISLSFAYGSDIAMAPLYEGGPYLLDEIYRRTLKMERERRYCMRFLRPLVSIERIRVEIEVEDSRHPLQKHRTSYALEETGYPIQPSPQSIHAFGSDLLEGQKQAEYLREKWGLT